MNELNPNHPVTVEFREQRHKLCAILMLNDQDTKGRPETAAEAQHAPHQRFRASSRPWRTTASVPAWLPAAPTSSPT